MLVGGHADNVVDLCGEGNADVKLPCLDKRQTMLTKYPHIQCFTCPAHDIDGFTKIICGSREEIQMQRNEMGGVGVQHVTWDDDFFEKAFAQVRQCIQTVRSLSGSRTRSLVSCAQRLHVSTVGLSRDGFTLKGGIGSIRR